MKAAASEEATAVIRGRGDYTWSKVTKWGVTKHWILDLVDRLGRGDKMHWWTFRGCERDKEWHQEFWSHQLGEQSKREWKGGPPGGLGDWSFTLNI